MPVDVLGRPSSGDGRTPGMGATFSGMGVCEVGIPGCAIATLRFRKAILFLFFLFFAGGGGNCVGKSTNNDEGNNRLSRGIQYI